MIASVKGTGRIQPQSSYDLRKGGFLQILDAGARYLSLTEEQVRQRLRAGNSLAEIAQAQGKSPEGLKSALLSVFPLTQKSDQLGAVLDRMMTEHPRIKDQRGQQCDTGETAETLPTVDPPGPGESSGSPTANWLG